jgi:hypothetical protein
LIGFNFLADGFVLGRLVLGFELFVGVVGVQLLLLLHFCGFLFSLEGFPVLLLLFVGWVVPLLVDGILLEHVELVVVLLLLLLDAHLLWLFLLHHYILKFIYVNTRRNSHSLCQAIFIIVIRLEGSA